MIGMNKNSMQPSMKRNQMQPAFNGVFQKTVEAANKLSKHKGIAEKLETFVKHLPADDVVTLKLENGVQKLEHIRNNQLHATYIPEGTKGKLQSLYKQLEKANPFTDPELTERIKARIPAPSPSRIPQCFSPAAPKIKDTAGNKPVDGLTQRFQALRAGVNQTPGRAYNLPAGVPQASHKPVVTGGNNRVPQIVTGKPATYAVAGMPNSTNVGIYGQPARPVGQTPIMPQGRAFHLSTGVPQAGHKPVVTRGNNGVPQNMPIVTGATRSTHGNGSGAAGVLSTLNNNPGNPGGLAEGLAETTVAGGAKIIDFLGGMFS